jgi:uncharacterized BrkB/YihY/UPF0761 family membrane protein
MAWSKTHAALATDWAIGARETHASVDVGFRVAERDRRVAAAVLAGGVAYRFFFWLLALAVVGAAALGFTGAGDAEDVASDQGAGAALADAVGDAATASHSARWWLLLVGVWLLLWTGYMGAKTLVLVHATVWGVTPPRIGNALRASLLFTGAVLAYIAAMAGTRWLREETDALGLVFTLALVVVPFAFWLVASRWLPRRTDRWLDLAPGAALVALGVQALNLFTTYLLGPKLENATELYGGIGVATTILFWLYIVGRLVIGAAILNEAVAERRPDGAGNDRSPAGDGGGRAD